MSRAGGTEALTPRRRTIVVAMAVVAGLTRIAAIARTPWDWDEFLFLLAMRDYDVGAHHPHPPGFPLFIAAAKLVQPVVSDPFRALQAVVFCGAVALFPLLFAYCREIHLGFAGSLAAATLFAFLPNVWFYGGTAFSDVPAVALGIAAAALLLRGSRSEGALLTGALVLGVAAGFRPQNLLLGAAPALIAAWHQRRRVWLVPVAALLVAAVVLVSYLGAASITGIDRYRAAVGAHADYITATDTVFSATRRPAVRLLDDFFIRPYRNLPLNALLTILAAAGGGALLLRREKPLLVAAATFGPFALFAWLFLDHFSASRFSIGYLPLFAILAARGAEGVSRGNEKVRGAIVSAFVIVSAVWIHPALGEVRTRPSPPVAAAEWIRSAAPRGTTIYAQSRVAAMADALLPSFPRVVVAAIPAAPEKGALFLTEGEVRDARVFRRGRLPLWDLVRRRYFDISVTEVERKDVRPYNPTS